MFTVSHIGIVVADLERATRFYCDGLGFARGMDSNPGDEVARMSEFAQPVAMRCRFVGLGGLRIELMQVLSPAALPSPGRRPLNLVGGPSHLALRVDDMATALDLVRSHGGRVLDETRTRYALFPDEDIDLCYCLDPDDVRIALSCLGPQGIAIVEQASPRMPPPV